MQILVEGLLDNAPCGFLSFDDAGRIMCINTTLLQRLGYTSDDLSHQHIEKILGVGTRIFYQTHLFPLVMLHGRAQEVFIMLRARDGDDVGMLCNAARRERDGMHVTDCVFMEVQERRKFEEALLAARQAADRANVALEARTREAEDAAAQLETQGLELELQHQQLQEQATEIESQSEAVTAANRELRTLNADLQKQRAVADEANRAKSNFLAIMSHELRTPLNAIGGYVQLLEMEVHGPVTEAQKVALGRIDRSQRHLLRLINDVLNLARIEAGRVEYVVESVPLQEVIGNVLPMVDPQIAAKGLRFEAAVPQEVKARADREKVQQILLNLLTNAIKFTSEGGSVSIEAGEKTASQVFLRVTDTGLGIPPEMLDKVFEPFIQVDSSRSRSTEGTGLGLAISRDLARGMGGDLSATSNLGIGSSFQLDLPRA
ncbi:MAG TPA: ATP-binding protein [Gemmatimonadaceae bacterium]|nr:ATP-binding protein [Gemmatimonadaceae bacterium]